MKPLRVLISSLLAAAALAGGAHAQTTTLKYSNWLPPGQAMRVEVIEPWIAEVEKVTQGRVKIETLPKVVGTVGAQFDVARDDQADLVVFVPSYTANRFEILEVLQLPFMSDNPERFAPIADRFYRQRLASYGEFKGVFPLSLFVVSPGQLFTVKRPVHTVADFKGLKIRSPQPSAAQALTLLGATPVSKPVSEVYELLSSGVLDGTLMPAESMPSFKLTDLVSSGAIIPGALYNTVLVMGINEDKWKSLRQDDRDAIMKISGETFARSVGRAYAKGDLAAYESMRKSGKPVEPLPAAVVNEMKTALRPIESEWIERAKKKGVAEPQKLIDSLRSELVKQ
ncbi:MAG TPA: TRAP transporter substrate-binding protein [Ramlibacter sp.]|uniref:TRAP transporter substrate-binding protein n=1 Tax=Ramlibacter sp. TaxID=1917967 RepID=UPI002B8ECB2E|nr:TRAP transporter substrate-binding protein [Ramlibacter sp.]HVZ44211.1 TRAP transporter substrate-binding protein [Ramlibacter sp.]